MNLFELTRTLMDIPSVSGEEGEVGRFLASHLEGLGYRVESQEVEPGRANVLARTGARPRVVLSTHMDTVPPFIPSREDATHIHGRGACDARKRPTSPSSPETEGMSISVLVSSNKFIGKEINMDGQDG